MVLLCANLSPTRWPGAAVVGQRRGIVDGDQEQPLSNLCRPAGAERETPAPFRGKKDVALHPRGQPLAGFSSCEKSGSDSDQVAAVSRISARPPTVECLVPHGCYKHRWRAVDPLSPRSWWKAWKMPLVGQPSTFLHRLRALRSLLTDGVLPGCFPVDRKQQTCASTSGSSSQP